MRIQANLLTLGKDPDVTITKKGMMMKVPVAENHRQNKGTDQDPDWQTINTSWFDVVAFGDTASEFVDQMTKGDAFKLNKGYHSWKNIGTKSDPDYRPSYVIVDFEKIEKKNDRSSS